MRNAAFTRRCQGCVAIISIGKLCPACVGLARSRAKRGERREQLSTDPERIGSQPRLQPRPGGLFHVSQCPHWNYYRDQIGLCLGCGYSASELVDLGHARRAS